MKKLLTFILVSLMIISLSGCTPNEPKPDPTPTDKEVEIYVDYNNGNDIITISAIEGEPLNKFTYEVMLEVYCYDKNGVFTGWTVDGKPFAQSDPVKAGMTLKANYENISEYVVNNMWFTWKVTDEGAWPVMGGIFFDPDNQRVFAIVYDDLDNPYYESYEKVEFTENEMIIYFVYADGSSKEIHYEIDRSEGLFRINSGSNYWMYADVELNADQLLAELAGHNWTLVESESDPCTWTFAFDKENATITQLNNDGSSIVGTIKEVTSLGMFEYILSVEVQGSVEEINLFYCPSFYDEMVVEISGYKYSYNYDIYAEK